ncbi:GNAT family N-acetyltransferase [Jatrophihabitans sp. YIM 134969]
MTAPRGRIRSATAADAPQLLRLWSLLFGEDVAADDATWRPRALEWTEQVVEQPSVAHLPLVDVGGAAVACAVGTLELGVPNPYCPRGRTVRLANLVTVPEQRGLGHGTQLVAEVVQWARSIDADRVDLSATAEGRRIYERAGFVVTSAPRMKLVI